MGSDVDSQPEKEAKKLKEQVEVIQVQSSAQQVPVPDLLTGIFSNTLPDPTLKHPTRWALKIVNKQTKDFFTEEFLKKENRRQLRSATKKYWFNPTNVPGQ